MKKPATTRDIQRVTFVESLYNSLKKQAVKAFADHKKYVKLAKSYLDDGLEESESVELLMIDGLNRESAESYVAMAIHGENGSPENSLPEYSFQFEDVFGKVWSSYDIGKTIEATNDKEAWIRSEEFLTNSSDVEFLNLLSVNRIS